MRTSRRPPRPPGRGTQEPNELDRAVAIATPLGLNSPQPIADIDLAVPSLPRPSASTALFLVPILTLLPNRLSRALRLTRTREQSPLPEPPPPPPQRLPPSPPHKPHYHHHHHHHRRRPSSDPPNSHHTHRTSRTKAGDLTTAGSPSSQHPKLRSMLHGSFTQDTQSTRRNPARAAKRRNISCMNDIREDRRGIVGGLDGWV